MNEKSRLSMIVLLGISLFLIGSKDSALSAQLNPYGAYVTGSTLNDIVPAQQNQYANGDQYGSGSLTLNASGSASVDGGYASSMANVVGNQLVLNASAATPFPGPVSSVVANADSSMWETVTFGGGTAGQIGTLILSASSTSDSIFAYGNGAIVMYQGLSLIAQNSFDIPPGTQSWITSYISFPLDVGPVQIIESVSVHTSASWGSGINKSDITFDPGWAFILPPGVSLASSSGTVYPTLGGSVRILRGDSTVNFFATLQDAYNAALPGDTIQTLAMNLTETLTFSNDIVVSLQGGYNSDFGLITGITTIIGNLMISGGTVTVENLLIQ